MEAWPLPFFKQMEAALIRAAHGTHMFGHATMWTMELDTAKSDLELLFRLNYGILSYMPAAGYMPLFRLLILLLLCRSSVSIWEMGEQWSLIKSSERELFRSTRL